MSPTVVQNELFGDPLRSNVLRTQTRARYWRLQKVLIPLMTSTIQNITTPFQKDVAVLTLKSQIICNEIR